MPWFAVDDSFHGHPKLAALEGGTCLAQSIALWTVAGSWCAQHLTDGLVPKTQLRKLVPFSTAKAASELVRVGLWEVATDGYQFRDWIHYQPSKAEVEEKRSRASARTRKSRAIAASRVTDSERNALHDPAGNASVTLSPSHPIPSPSQSANALSSRACLEEGPHIDVRPFSGLWCASAFGKRYEQEARSAFMERAKCDWVKIARWTEKTAEMRGKTPESLFADVLEHWFTDDWVRRERFPVGAFGSGYANFVERKEKPKPKGQAKAATHEDFARIAAQGADDVGF